MIRVQDCLRAGDPLATDRDHPATRRAMMREAVLAVPLGEGLAVPERREFLHRVGLGVGTAAAVSVAAVGVWRSLEGTASAAVRFEVRLAETNPSPGLREAPVGTLPRLVYLHDEVVVTNDHLVGATVVPAGEWFGIEIVLSPEGARRLRAATGNHVGRPVALLVDGLVVMAPTVRSAIAEVGIVSGRFTREDAERLARGMWPR